jgi:hypothetical protein
MLSVDEHPAVDMAATVSRNVRAIDEVVVSIVAI